MIKRERSALPLPRYVLRKPSPQGILDATAVLAKNVGPKVPTVQYPGADRCRPFEAAPHDPISP